MPDAASGAEPSPGPVARANDAFRRALGDPSCGLAGRVVVTRGVASRGPAFVFAALTAVREHDVFTPDDDPAGERDFGVLEIEGAKLFWKIDLYDPDYAYGSARPEDPSMTRRVLTVLLADEY